MIGIGIVAYTRSAQEPVIANQTTKTDVTVKTDSGEMATKSTTNSSVNIEEVLCPVDPTASATYQNETVENNAITVDAMPADYTTKGYRDRMPYHITP